MVPQVAWSYICKVTLFAFVRFFSKIIFQMCPKTACMNRFKVALALASQIVFICMFFLQNEFSNASSNCLYEEMQSCIGYIYAIFPICEFSHGSSSRLKLQIVCIVCISVFKCVIKLPVWTEAKLHWLHLCDFPEWIFKRVQFFRKSVFKCLLLLSARIDAKLYWLHLSNFSPICVLKYVFNSHALIDAKSH